MDIGSTTPEVNASTAPTSVSLDKAISDSDTILSVANVAMLLRAIKKQDGDFILFQAVDQDIFQGAKAARERRGLKVRFHYYPAQQQLLVTIPKFPHENATAMLNLAIYHGLFDMGLSEYDLKPGAATEFIGSGGSSGEPDACFLPPTRSRDPGGWPTLVIETGFSQSLQSLRTKMRWWFAASDHAVKIVILLKASPTSQTILLEKHIKDVAQTRSGATTTRNMPGLHPQLRQSITITPQPGSVPAIYDVQGGALILEFSLLFLRPADAARGERDIALGTARLARLAESVWERS